MSNYIMKRSPLFKLNIVPALFALFLCLTCQSQQPSQRWTEAAANQWYSRQPTLIGANFIPKTAINELEMWQADTFDPREIDTELAWAEAIRMDTMRVFLHDLLWKQDPLGFEQRIDTFLQIAAKHHIRPIFVLFDSCWDPHPELGRQHPPRPGIHNSGWVQSPGADALRDPAQYPRLREYVAGIVGKFAADPRILAWDLWNEPDNTNESSYSKDEPHDKTALVDELLPQVFEWARSAHPTQPLTSGVWQGDWSSPAKLSPTAHIQLDESDVISFHNYGWPEDFEQHVKWLEAYHRPLICTEFMARGAGSTFDTILPVASKYGVGMISWGLVEGKTQTNLPWDSWQRPYTTSEPPIWFHEVFYPDGKPYREREVELIQQFAETPRP